VDFHRESRGCPPFGVSAPSVLFSIVVPSNIMPGGVSTLPPFPCEDSSPCTALDGGKWEPGCAFKGGSISIEGEIIVFGEPWFAPLPPPLVPSPLA